MKNLIVSSFLLVTVCVSGWSSTGSAQSSDKPSVGQVGTYQLVFGEVPDEQVGARPAVFRVDTRTGEIEMGALSRRAVGGNLTTTVSRAPLGPSEK